jgi:hypothetical protein
MNRRIFAQDSPEEKIGGLRRQLQEYNEVMGINQNYHSQPLKKHPDYALSFHDENRLPESVNSLDQSVSRFSVTSQSARANSHVNVKPNFIRLESKSLTPNKRHFSPDNLNNTTIQGFPANGTINQSSYADDLLGSKMMTSQLLLLNNPLEGSSQANFQPASPKGFQQQVPPTFRLILQARDVNNLTLGQPLSPTGVSQGWPQQVFSNNEMQEQQPILIAAANSVTAQKFTLIEQNGLIYQVPLFTAMPLNDNCKLYCP